MDGSQERNDEWMINNDGVLKSNRTGGVPAAVQKTQFSATRRVICLHIEVAVPF